MRKLRLEYVHVRICGSRDKKRDWSEHLVTLPVLFQGRLAPRGAPDLPLVRPKCQGPGTGVVGEWKNLGQALRSGQVGGGVEIRAFLLRFCDSLWHFLTYL